jgi:L-rhamnose mutarotase
MKFIANWQLFKESKNNKEYSPKNIVQEICISMVLLNNEFLDNILDRGLKARYSENSQVFLTDLKNLLLSKNRLHLGKFESNKCVVDDEVSKINGFFNEVDFDIEKDWDKLVNSRITARNIIDKLLPDEKLISDRISKIFWIGPNKTEDFNEDIVVETTDGKQYSLFLNKNLSLQKTASFNKFADDLVPEDIDNLFSEENMSKWDKLAQSFVKITYESANKNIQLDILNSLI